MDKEAYMKKRLALERAQRDEKRLEEEIKEINEKVNADFEKEPAVGEFKELKSRLAEIQNKIQVIERSYQARFQKACGNRIPQLQDTKRRIEKLKGQLIELMDADHPMPEEELAAMAPQETPVEDNVVQMQPPAEESVPASTPVSE